jgi:predicted CXXCH cytochrome family protein
MRLLCFSLTGLLFGSLIAAGFTAPRPIPIHAGEQTTASDPNAACASCHREIYERYRNTPMANASGPAAAGQMPADFQHVPSGIRYQVFNEGDRVWLTYERENAPTGHELNGRQEVRYYLGSGLRGQTYLYERQGYWFEAPINWYGKKQIWDMTPNYLAAREMPNLPLEPGCLRCHASGVPAALPDARNHYAAAPFAHGGVTCAGCHGDASAHLISGGKVHMADIDAMEAVRRDSVCLSCHLEGKTAVIRLGKDLVNFAPGDNLFDYALFFVYGNENGSGGRFISQWEALLKSVCKQKSGDRMTCTTCHNPHGSPPASERVAFYRQRCLQCHNQAGFAQSHHSENQDCTSCHMARPSTNDIAHEQVTDHRIAKSVNQQSTAQAATSDLRVAGSFPAGDRELGLAYAQLSGPANPQYAARAIALLRSAEKQAGGAPSDHALHAQLGFLEQVAGKSEDAAHQYELALQADPYDSLAAGNLALLAAQHHRYGVAAQLWSDVFGRDPAQLGAGLNLAVVECGAGKRSAALGTLDRLLSFAPDNAQARAMAEAIRSGKKLCTAQ